MNDDTKNIKSRVEDQINYQDGAVVSREIMKNASGSVTLFAFDKGQGLSEHKTPFEALVFIVDGEAEITIAGKNNKLRKGEMIHMPSKKTHALKATKRFKMLLTMLSA